MIAKIIENRVVVKAAFTLSDLVKAIEFAGPKVAQLVSEEGDSYYGITAACCSSIERYGIEFEVSDDKLLAWVILDDSIKDKKQYVIEEFGVSLSNLQKVEKQIETALKDINGELKSIEDAVQLMDKSAYNV